MALEINLYLAPVVAFTPPFPVPAGVTAYRAVLCEHVVGPGEWFDGLDHPSRRVVIAVVHAEPATHQAIQADTRITRLLPMVSATREQIVARFNTPLVTLFPAAELVSTRSALEAIGIDMSWTNASTTARDLVRGLFHHKYLVQRAHGEGDANRIRLYDLDLTATVASLTSQQRTAIRNWMTSRGMDISWITNSTTIRAVTRYIHERIATETLDVGGVGRV